MENIAVEIKAVLEYPGAGEVWGNVKHWYLPVQQIIDDTLSASEANED